MNCPANSRVFLEVKRMDLFQMATEHNLKKKAPLAERLRPRQLDDFVGQKHIVGEGSLLKRCIKADRLQSMIFYGPPGTGKTTLAKIIAEQSSYLYKQINAVTSGIKEIREVIQSAEEGMSFKNTSTLLFIDEIHRFNKSQQDALLPVLENGLIILIGATTENPMFEVNKALLSRSMVLEFKELKEEDLQEVMKKGIDLLEKDEKTIIQMDKNAEQALLYLSSGDSRVMLNALELAVLTTSEMDGKITITSEIISQSIQKKVIAYEKNGNEHYDTISAFIKSMRGSNPDATLYWLAKMIYAGEDPKFIARRIVICASEDVGNADPMALNVAVSAFTAVDFIGMPEGRIILAQAAVYVATAPKSNACYLGINSALADIKDKMTAKVPFHLKDSKTKAYDSQTEHQDYKYPHDYEHGYVKQEYLPTEFEDISYYNPKEIGYERKIIERLKFYEKLL